MIDKDGKVVPSVFKEMTLDEISAVDRPAQPGATMSIMKRSTENPFAEEDDEDEEGKDRSKKTKKRAIMLTPTDGHTHTLVDETGPAARGMAGETSYTNDHTHPWVRNPDTGAFTVGMAMGHEHNILLDGGDRASAAITLEKVTDGTPEPTEASKSTSGVPTADSIGTVPNEVDMTEKNEKTVADEAVAKQLDELTKRAERAEAVSELTDAQRGIFKSLDADGQDAYLALSPDQRQAEVTKVADANAVVYTDADGAEYRKNDDPRLVALAKRADVDRVAREAAEAATAEGDLRKRAEELKHLPGDVSVRMSMLKGIDALPEAQRAPALEALKAQDLALGEAFKRAGTSAVPEQANPLDAIAKRIREATPSLSEHEAMAKALETPEGEAAYAKSLGL